MQLVRYNDDRHLSVVPPRFKLPRGWRAKEVIRADGSRSDTYYYEIETGRKFRSTKEVQRYLNGEEEYTRKSTRRSYTHSSGYERMLLSGEKNSECRRMIVSGGKLLMLDDEESPKQLAIVTSSNAAQMAPYILPDGWIVEEVPRRYDSHWVDRYYYEPGTGLKFRSLVAVQRYLAESEENVPLSEALEEIKENKPLLKVFKLENRFKNCISKKNNTPKVNTQDSSFVGPPMKVNWVLSSSRGDSWNPFISDTSVPDSVKKQWNDRFMTFMNDNASNSQNIDTSSQ